MSYSVSLCWPKADCLGRQRLMSNRYGVGPLTAVELM